MLDFKSYAAVLLPLLFSFAIQSSAATIFNYECGYNQDGGYCQSNCSILLKAIDPETGKDKWFRSIESAGSLAECSSKLKSYDSRRLRPVENFTIRECGFAQDGGYCNSSCSIILKSVDAETGQQKWWRAQEYVGSLSECQKRLFESNRCEKK